MSTENERPAQLETDTPQESGEGKSSGVQPETGPVTATQQPSGEAPPVAGPTKEVETYVPYSLSVGDGFKFGCGFLMAVAIAGLLLFLLSALAFLVSSLVGLNIPVSR